MRLIPFFLLVLCGAALAQAPAPDVTWPRETKAADGTVITVYQPQIERWAENRLSARAAVSVAKPGNTEPQFGVIELSARTAIDKSADQVMLSEVRIDKGTFPGATKEESKKIVAALRAALPKEGWPVSAQALQANLAIGQARASQKAQPLKNDPPTILFRTEPSMLVMIDGEPAPREVKEDPNVMRIVNTTALIFFDKATSTYYLRALSRWWEAKALNGEWKSGPQMLASIDKPREALEQQYDPLDGKDAQGNPRFPPDVAPNIIVATTPTELLQSTGKPNFSPIPRTQLLYLANSQNDVFLELGSQAYYVLISGRWFSAKTLNGPWAFIPGKSLPADFAKIPADHPTADVLASVPNTPQSREAAIANQIPQTAEVQRDVQPTPITFDGGAPKWTPIDGTPLSYAPNSPSPVIRVDPKTYYTVQNGVWFSATAFAGPWSVATMVPAVIYSIPPSSPLHYVTYVRVYSSTSTVVFVGYTPGYYGTVVSSDGVVVYGTGYVYPPYIGPYWYYPPPYYTYGYGARYSYGFVVVVGGGWRGPCCYGGGGVHISHHTNITVNNSYNRWGGKSSTITGSGGRELQTKQVGNTNLAKGSGSNDVYAGRDGNVYRRDESGNWQQHQNGSGWSDVNKPEQRPSAETRPSTGTGPSGETRPSAQTRPASSENLGNLERQHQSREAGAQRAQQFRGGGGGGGRGGRR